MSRPNPNHELRATPAYRVRWLLRFQFSPAIRAATIESLLADPATRLETLRQLQAGK